MIQIKKTKSVEMSGDEKVIKVSVDTVENIYPLFIPMKSVFQVKRGLESYIQRFYRKHNKN